MNQFEQSISESNALNNMINGIIGTGQDLRYVYYSLQETPGITNGFIHSQARVMDLNNAILQYEIPIEEGTLPIISIFHVTSITDARTGQILPHTAQIFTEHLNTSVARGFTVMTDPVRNGHHIVNLNLHSVLHPDVRHPPVTFRITGDHLVLPS